MRKGLVEVSKTGWAYILDRETGKPLIVSVTAAGRNAMPAFAGSYSSDDLRDIASYILDVLAKKN